MPLRLAFRWSLVLLLTIPAALAVIRVAAWVREGDDHVPTPVAQGLALSKLFHAPITRLPDVGHVPHIDDPIHFLPALDAAIEEPTR